MTLNSFVSLISRSRTTAQALVMEVDLHSYNMVKVQPSEDGGNNKYVHHYLVDFIIQCKVGHSGHDLLS